MNAQDNESLPRRRWRAMILSVGGSDEPIWKTIVTVCPELAVLVASQQSVPMCGRIKDACDGQNVFPRFEHVVIEHPDDLTECYHAGLEAAERVKRYGVEPQDVAVDITGGTKVMSAGLALATVREGFWFSYVSGTERTAGGLGIVVSGSERSTIYRSPWQLFAVEEKAILSLQFNSFQFAAAGQTIDRLLGRGTLLPHERHLMKILRQVVEAYAAWDRFDHPKACQTLREQVGYLRSYVQDRYETAHVRFLKGVEENLALLQRLQEESRGFRDLVRGHVADLVSNADRRACEGKFDDAVARLYRAAEMLGQIAFRKRFDCSTAEVNPECLPDAIREEYIRKYGGSAGGPLRVPLWAAYRALAEAGDPLGAQVRQSEAEIKAVMSARNESVLAHGITPCQRSTYDRLRHNVLALGNLGPEELVQFPRLSFVQGGSQSEASEE